MTEDEIMKILRGSPLYEIMKKEIELGNRCSEPSYDAAWLKAVCVIFDKPFIAPVKKIDGVIFRDLNDPHYWKAEYIDKINHCMLICMFDNNPENLNLRFYYEDGSVIERY